MIELGRKSKGASWILAIVWGFLLVAGCAPDAGEEGRAAHDVGDVQGGSRTAAMQPALAGGAESGHESVVGDEGSGGELGRLRAENVDLRGKLGRAEVELAEARRRVAELEERNSALEREVGARAVQIARERQEAKAEIMELRKKLSGGSPLQRAGSPTNESATER